MAIMGMAMGVMLMGGATILCSRSSRLKGIIYCILFRTLIGENFTLSNFALQDYRAMKQKIVADGHVIAF